MNVAPSGLLNTTDEALQSVVIGLDSNVLHQLHSIDPNNLLPLDTNNSETIRQYLRVLVPKSPFHDVDNLSPNPALSKEVGELVLSVFFKPSPEDEVPRERFWIFWDLLLPRNMRTNRSRAGMFIGKFCKLPENTQVGSKRNKVAVKNSQRMYLGMYGPTLDNATDKDVKRLADILQLKSEDILAFDAAKFIELSDKLLQLQLVTEKHVKQETSALQLFPPVNTLRGAKQFAVVAELAGREGEDFQLTVNKRKRTWTIKGERRLKLARLFYEQSDVHDDGSEASEGQYAALPHAALPHAALPHAVLPHAALTSTTLTTLAHDGLLLSDSGETDTKSWLKEEIFQGPFERCGEFPPEVDLGVSASKVSQDGMQIWSWPLVSEEEIAQ